MSSLASSIDAASVTDLHDEDSEHFVLDGIDDPPSTMSHPIPIILPGELLASWRAWVVGKRLDPLDDLLSNSPRLDGLDLFGCGRLDANSIGCHGASV